MQNNKSWWKSKTILTGIVVLGIGVSQAFGVELPYELIYSLCAAFGLYGIRDAIGGLEK